MLILIVYIPVVESRGWHLEGDGEIREQCKQPGESFHVSSRPGVYEII